MQRDAGTPSIGDPRALGTWLLAYTVAVLAGAWVWGRWWVEAGEGFSVLLGACARISPPDSRPQDRASKKKVGRYEDIAASPFRVVGEW